MLGGTGADGTNTLPQQPPPVPEVLVISGLALLHPQESSGRGAHCQGQFRVPFSSCFQSFPASSGSFPMSQFFASGGQSIGVSASAISPSNEYSGLISFRIDWFDYLAVHETLKSLLQHHSSKASILPCSAFFIVQLSHPYKDALPLATRMET